MSQYDIIIYLVVKYNSCSRGIQHWRLAAGGYLSDRCSVSNSIQKRVDFDTQRDLWLQHLFWISLLCVHSLPSLRLPKASILQSYSSSFVRKQLTQTT
jgi:hypothetical protein